MPDESEPSAIPVVCSECDTSSKVPFEDVDEVVVRHNERLHDGESVAGVDPAVLDELADFVAADLGRLDDEP